MITAQDIEALMLAEFKQVPFHNLFLLNNLFHPPSAQGGTCSDKVLSFLKKLTVLEVEVRLHSAFINEQECHRLLVVKLAGRSYLADVGSGWPSTKLFPMFEPISYQKWGMGFRTEITDDSILLFHSVNEKEILMERIPLDIKEESLIYEQINNRYADLSIYPFRKNLRFSLLTEDTFHFIRGNQHHKFHQAGNSQQQLSKSQIRQVLSTTLKFDLTGLEIDFGESLS